MTFVELHRLHYVKTYGENRALCGELLHNCSNELHEGHTRMRIDPESQITSMPTTAANNKCRERSDGTRTAVGRGHAPTYRSQYRHCLLADSRPCFPRTCAESYRTETWTAADEARLSEKRPARRRHALTYRSRVRYMRGVDNSSVDYG